MTDSTSNNGKVTLSNCTFTKDGSIFAGWSLSADGNIIYENEDTVTNSNGEETITVYAKWVENSGADPVAEYTIKFNANDGTGTMDDFVGYANTQVKLRKNTFTRSGYKFVGWTEVKDGTDLLTGYYTVTRNVTLYAKWEKIPVVTLNLNGGSWEDNYATEYGSGIVADGSVYIPGKYYLERDHYEFLGWSETQNGTVKVEAGGAYYTASADITLYAQWKKLHTVTFDLTGGSWVDDDDKDRYGNGLSLAPGYEEVSLPGRNNVIRDSYAFTGWALTKDG